MDGAEVAPPVIDLRPAPPPSGDVVVIGGGIVGASTAFHAARAGLRPVLVERRQALCTLTTPASTGAFRLQFDNREEFDLVSESVALFESFSEIPGARAYDLGIRRAGYLWATTSPTGARRQERLAAMQRGWGLDDVEVVAGRDARVRWPYLSQDVTQVRFRAGDGFLDPKELTLGLIDASGAAVVVGCEATAFEVDGAGLAAVTTAAGRISTRVAVIAAGPFSAAVAARAGVDLPLWTVNRHKIVMPHVPQVPPGAPMTIDEDTGAHWRPALAGAFLLFTDPHTPPSPPTEDVAPDHRFVFDVLHPDSPTSVARISPFWRDVWARATWFVQSGQYDMTPDRRPLLGETVVPGLFVNCGYSGHGIMAGPAGSRHLVDVLTGRVAHNPFRVDRTFEERDHDVL